MMEKYYLFAMLLKPIFGRPGTITAMSTFGEIMEENMRSILYSPDEATSQSLEEMMKTSNIYDESFEFCDEDKDEIVTMEELLWCESEFLDALNRKHNYQMTKMTIGDKNKDGKLHKEEWRAAGAVWDLAFGQTMVNSLGNQGYCTSKSVFRVLGVIGHFYNDVKYAEAEKILYKSDNDHNNKWTDVEIGYIQQSFYNQFVKHKFSHEKSYSADVQNMK